ncbi:MAG: diphosphomevalonate decarboxylase [Thermoanaerobaculia bacterium]
MIRATAVAPANIALIKYWGTRVQGRPVPANASLSMTLDRCVSRCTVEPGEGGGHDVRLVSLEGALTPAPEAFAAGVAAHLDRLLEWAGESMPLRVTTGNTFPTGAGLASSASGFAALALAFVAASGRRVTPADLSLLARMSGSGSAARSVFGGWVLWPEDADDPDGPAIQVATPDHWDLRDVIAVVDGSAKEVGSREGHLRASSSPHYARRLELLPDRLLRARSALAARDFEALTEVVEEEATELHLIAMSSRPPIFYWAPGTVEVLAAVRAVRRKGVRACATIDAGPNVHVLCPAEDESRVVAALESLAGVGYLIRDRVGAGPSVEVEP